MSNLHDDFPPHAQAREEAMLAEKAQARAELRDRFAMAALTKREPKISNADHKAIAKAVRRDLRDRFAMSALTGMKGNPNSDGTRHDYAKWAYEYADAMLKAREENSQ